MTIGDKMALNRASRSVYGGTLRGHSINLASQDGSLSRFNRLCRTGLVRVRFGRFVITNKGIQAQGAMT